MKKKYFFLALLLISGNAWAQQQLQQLTCTNCSVRGVSTTSTRPAIPILTSPGTYTGNIVLTGNSEFEITGTGNYTINGVISEAQGQSSCSLTYKAPAAGATGHNASITLTGGPNTYRGLTTIAGGYLICNKPGGGAVPGNIKISAASGSRAHLWCQKDAQLESTAIIDFRGAQGDSYIHLNGTTQTIAGIQANNVHAVVENNNEGSSFPTGTAVQLSANPAILSIVAGTTACIFERGVIRKGSDSSPALTIRITRGTQIIRNPGNSIRQVTFETSAAEQGEEESPPTLQFDHSGANASSLIELEFIIFKGEGTIKKTGSSTMVFTNSAVLQSAGEIRVSGGILQNGDNNSYTNGNEKNKATLQIDAPDANNHNPAFDLYGNSSVFDGLTGGGWVQNSRYSTAVEDGYSWLTVGQDNLQKVPLFSGIIRDNSSGGSTVIRAGGPGGVALRKVGTGTQVLIGRNLYTGPTTVSSGTLKLQGNGVLGAANSGDASYGGVLEISNVSSGPPAIFEHSGTQTQVFTSDITNTGTGTILGTYLQSGAGETSKTIINGVKSFAGKVRITGGYLGGSGDISKANTVTVEGGGSIGGGTGVTSGGATLKVSNLTFAAAASKLIVTAMPETNNPSLVEVKEKGTPNPGSITVAANNFTVDIMAANLMNGYILKCSNGASLPLPTLGINNTGKPIISFRWDATGLYMEIGGLTCDNCTVTRPDNTVLVGSPESPAVIRSSPGIFAGTITLTGNNETPCKFTIYGTGNYTLSGQITGYGPLIYNALNAEQNGFSTGITLSGSSDNDYTGLTTIAGGYVVCNKEAVAVPGNLKISAVSNLRFAHLWCQKNSQLGAGATIDFSDAKAYSIIHLNGTTQTVAGLIANNNQANNKAVVKKNYGSNSNNYFPAGILEREISKKAGTLNIAAGDRYVFGGGGRIGTGEEIWTGEEVDPNERLLTLNIKSGTQVIEDPGTDITNLILTSVVEGPTPSQAVLEFSTGDNSEYSLGANITLEGGGTIKKTGEGCVAMSDNTTVTRSGLIQVCGGTLKNGANSRYATNDGAKINKATLQVEAPSAANNNPTFDMWNSASIFDGLTGGGIVQNSWISTEETPSEAYTYSLLTLGQNNSQDNPIFDGIIRDNATSGSTTYAQAGYRGYSGVALRKVGTGTQVLTGRNRYTGSTTVSSGTLKLEGIGQLGGASPADINTYGGVLEISNVLSGTPAIFEHNGTQTQVFTGGITNTGTGTLGTYLQSGSGKTIINGVGVGAKKSFAGNVRITGGFLGGSGDDLSNANRVTVEGGGSIGGGNGTSGGTLTVSNLTFAAAASKLIVTAMPGTNNPSLVEVMAKGTSNPGSISATNGFTVEVMNDAAIVSGYVLKCSNGLTGSLPPLPTVVNHTGRTVCFRWVEGTGLWMQISFGNITLTSTSLCPPINPVNLVVTVTAAYSDPRDYPSLPPLGAAIYFSLSDDLSVKSGEMTIRRVQGTTVTAIFNGKNQTTSDKSYTVTYNDSKNCAVKLDATIKPQPMLRVNSGNNPTCKGTPVELRATGTGLLTISSVNTNTATMVNATPVNGLVTATTLAAGNAVFFATDANGCRSEDLSVSVKDLPVMEDVVPGDILTLCKGQFQPSIPLRSDRTGDTKADAYKWEGHGDNLYDVGLADHNLSPPVETAIREFTAQNNGSTAQSRNVIVTPYNNQTGCYGVPKDFTIWVMPTPPPISSGRICANAGGNISNSIELTPDEDSATDKTNDPWTITAGSEYGRMDYKNPDKKKVTVSALDLDSQTEKTVTVQFTGRTGCKSYTVAVSPRTRLSYIRASNLCQYNGGLNEKASIEVRYSNPHGYTPNGTTGSWKRGNPADPASVENLLVSTSLATNDTDIKATFYGVAGTFKVWYVDNRTGCAGDKRVEIAIENLEAPETTTPVLLCENSQAPPLVVKNPQETYNYKWWSPGVGQPVQYAPTPSTRYVGEVEYKVSKVKTYNGAAATSTGIDPPSCTGPQAAIKVKVESSVSISPQENIDLTKLCSGTSINNFILIPTSAHTTTEKEKWLINDKGKTTMTIATAIVTNAVGNGDLTAGTVNSVNPVVQEIRFKPDNCPSNPVTVTINPKPTVSLSDLTLCANTQQAQITPGSGSGLCGATGYKWGPSGADNRAVVGIIDNIAEWQPSIPGFTTPSTEVALTRSMSITPYNSNTTCTGESRTWTITVKPNPTVIVPNRKHCPGDKVQAEKLTGTHEANSFSWTGGHAAGLEDGNGTSLPGYTVSPTASPDSLSVRIWARNISGCAGSSVFYITVNPKPSIQLSNVQNLCTGPTIETAAQANITVSSPIAGTRYKWKATFSDFRPDGRSVVNIVNGSKVLEFPTEEFTGKGNFTKKIIANDGSKAQITLSLTPLLGSCTGNPVDANFRVNGANLLADISNDSPEICSGGTTDIKIGSEGDGNTYTWEKIIKPGDSDYVLGFTPPESESLSRAITIRDVLTLDKNINKRGSIIYYISTWRHITDKKNGDYDCTGASVSHTVVVNPVPVLIPLSATASICSDETTAITCFTNLNYPESNNVRYSWEVSSNTVGAQTRSGLQEDTPKQRLTNANESEESVTYTITPWYKSDKSEVGKNCAGLPGTRTYQVAPRLSPTISSSTPEPVCLGDKITLKANKKADTKVTYQWLNGKNKRPVPGATGDSYDVPTDKESESSYAVTLTTTNCGSTTSEPKTVRVSADAYFTGGSASIDKTAASMGVAVKFLYTGPEANHLWDFNDNRSTGPGPENVTHSYINPGTYYPTLKVTKPNQEVCTKTFLLPALEIRDADPNTGYDVFPIPARDILIVNSSNYLQKVTIFDLNGKTVVEEAATGRSISLSVAHMARGIYVLKITDSEGVKHVKVSKE